MKNKVLKFIIYIFLILSFKSQVMAGECVAGNCANGQGTYMYAEGFKYVGEWKNNKRNGQGTLTSPGGGKYEGEFKDDEFNGQGTLLMDNGTKYVGEFKDGLYNGLGSLTLENGDKYVGAFKDNKRNGQGKYTFANGNKIVGRWKDNKQVKGESNFIETSENKAKRDTSNDDLYLYNKNEKYFEVYKEDSENKKKAKNTFNAAARCYNSLSLIDRKKSNNDIYFSRKELIQAMTYERSESIFGAAPEGQKKNRVSERSYNKAISTADRFVGQNCPQ